MTHRRDVLNEQLEKAYENASDAEIYRIGPIVEKLLGYKSFFDCHVSNSVNPRDQQYYEECIQAFIRDLPEFLIDYEEFNKLNKTTDPNPFAFHTCSTIALCAKKIIYTQMLKISSKLINHLKTNTALLKSVQFNFPRIVEGHVKGEDWFKKESNYAQNYANSGPYKQQKIGGKKYKKCKTRQKKRQLHKKFRKTLKRKAAN